MSESNYQILIGKLDEFIRKYYKNLLIKGAIYSTALVLVFYLAATISEHFGRFDSSTRTILFYSFVLSSAYVIGRFIAMPLFKLFRLGETISHDTAARVIGHHFPDVRDKLLNTLQLKRLSRNTGSQLGLIEASIEQRIIKLRPVPFASAINFRQNRKRLTYLIPPLLLLLLIVFTTPGIITDSTARLINHAQHFEELASFKFIIENDNLEAIQQQDFQLNIKITGEELPKVAYIQFEDDQFRLKKDSRISFHHLFKNVQRNIRFRFWADGFYSQEYELSALPNPIILNFNVMLDYPTYTGKKDQTLTNTGDLVVPAGTKIKWNFRTKDTQSLKMIIGSKELKLPQTGENQYSHNIQLLESVSYTIATENEFLKNKDPLHYSVNVIPDLYPSIEIEEQVDSISTKRVYFRGGIKDDYGFSRLTFNYKYLGEEGNPKTELKPENVPIMQSTTQEQFFYFWNLENLEINAGDQIEYYFEIWDNDGIHGSKSTKSQKRVFKAPTLEELEEKGEQKNEEIKDKIEESIKEAKNLQRDLEKLHRKMLEKKNLGWDEKKQIEEILQRQKELQKNVENIQQENLKKFNEQQEYKKMSEEVIKKQQQLEKLFEEVMTDEMKELYKELEELLDQMDKEKLQEMMQEMELSNKDIEKELDRTLEIFKQLEFEQKLEEAIEKLDELAKKQEQLSEESKDKETESEKLKEKQEDLNKEFEDIQKDLEDLKKKNEELETPNKMEDTKQEQQDIKSEMSKSSQQLGENQKKNASKSQKNASQKMQELSEQMRQMQASMQMQGNAEDLDALRQLLENLVQLSFDQEDLMISFKGLNKKDPKYVKLSQHQKKLKDDAKMIEDSLFALSKRVPQIESIVNREISAINSNLEKTIDHLSERQTPLAASKQQYVMTSVNNLALLLDEIVQQMQQQMSEQKFGNASCNKPGKGSKCSMSSMKKLQQQLNKQIQQLKDGMSKQQGKNPNGNKKGQQMSKELARLAAEQEAIRNELEKMARQLDKNGNQGGKGNLDELSKMMEETETDLVNKRITRETLKRQKEIMVRLLEHEKAEHQRELDEKRESHEGKNENFSNPSNFFEYNRLKQKEVELLKTVPPTLSPFYKNKVNEYFNTFEE